MPKLCIVCNELAPELPDRNRMGRPIKRVCKKCHAARLTGDMAYILEQHHKKRLKRLAEQENGK